MHSPSCTNFCTVHWEKYFIKIASLQLLQLHGALYACGDLSEVAICFVFFAYGCLSSSPPSILPFRQISQMSSPSSGFLEPSSSSSSSAQGSAVATCNRRHNLSSLASLIAALGLELNRAQGRRDQRLVENFSEGVLCSLALHLRRRVLFFSGGEWLLPILLAGCFCVSALLRMFDDRLGGF
uniref:Uncharacterized protein n=2 Tax=Physcomitrium patens TaxID=3218 RepID=A0A7I4EIP7_PHYPA